MSLVEKIKRYGQQTALVFDSYRYTYEDLTNKILYYSKEFEDVEKGSVISLVSDYSFDAIAIFFALINIKCIVSPVVSENNEEIQKRLKVISPDIIINLRLGNEYKYSSVSQSRHPLILKLREDKHSGLVLFSSGSTGEPKAMIHDLDILSESYVGKKAKNLSIMVFLMFDHIGGLNTLFNSLSMGAKVVIPKRREPEEVARLIEKERINVLPASPTFLNMMLVSDVKNKYELKSLRMITYGTEVMPESLLLRLKTKLPKVKLLQTFGTSETGIIQTSSRSSESLELKLDDPDQQYKIVDKELWLKSRTQVLGYLNHDMSSFSEDGWFKTGDLVEESNDGYLRIVGRKKEIINVGGEKVLPNEVESVVLEVEGVVDCMAYAQPNSINGQTVALDVVLDRNCSDTKSMKKEIRRYCSNQLDTYKVPTKIRFTEDAGVGERFKKIRKSRS